MKKEKCVIVGGAIVLIILIVIVVIIMVNITRKEAEDNKQYLDVTNEFVIDDQKYVCRETEKLKVTYPCITETIEYEDRKIVIMPYSDSTSELLVGGANEDVGRYIYRKVMLLEDVYSDNEDVKKVDYRLYDCSGLISKRDGNIVPNRISQSDYFPQVGDSVEVYESNYVTMLNGEYSSMIKEGIIMPFNIQIIEDVAIEKCDSKNDVTRLVNEQLEKAVLKAMVYYNDGSIEEKYYKLDYSNVQ